jgi:hypothetical protein
MKDLHSASKFRRPKNVCRRMSLRTTRGTGRLVEIPVQQELTGKFTFVRLIGAILGICCPALSSME